MEIILFSIPFFLGSMALEIYLSRKAGRGLFRFWDSMSNLSCGLQNILMGPWAALLSIPAYVFFYEHRILSIGLIQGKLYTVLLWVLSFVALDLGYYCYHRVSHRVNLFWAGHIVHHQSEEYNLSVALRQTATSTAMSFIFYLPLAIVGVPLNVFLSCSALNLLYQFWIHTELIKKLPAWAEFVLNTPSHHRVHHATNPQYLDKNYAGVFIVWDRLFGTFQVEVERPRYGIVRPLKSWSSWWAQVHYFVELAQRSTKAAKISDSIQVWFRPPEWRSMEEKSTSLFSQETKLQEKYAPVIPLGRKKYSVALFIAAFLIVAYFLARQAELSLSAKVFYSLLAALILHMMSRVALKQADHLNLG